MHRYLETILDRRRARVADEARALPPAVLEASLPPPPARRDYASEVRACGGFLVAEVKRASPSRGPIAPAADAARRARAYAGGGASAVSVLCEPDFFMGSREDVRTAAAAVDVPVLCKDFVVDPYQLLQARADGARWALLIVRILGPALARFLAQARRLGLEPLVEIHTERELGQALECGATLVGINARDLDTFGVDLDVVRRLAPRVPGTCACIAESGIRDPSDLLRLRDAGAHGFLIGEALMRVEDPAPLLRAFAACLRSPERPGVPPTASPERRADPAEALLGPMC